MIEKKIKNHSPINVVLVGVIQQEQTEELENEYLNELNFLAETAGAHTLKIFKQKLFFGFHLKKVNKEHKILTNDHCLIF